MKKAFTFILFIYILVFGISYAEYEDTFLFRNISWGKTIDEVETALAKDGLQFKTLNETDGSSGFPHSSLVDIMVDNVNLKEEYGNYIYAKTFSPITVAGYEVYSTSIYFAYLPDENNIITKSRDLTSFILAGYDIVPVDIDYATNDLINKLNSIYGDYDSEGTYNSTFNNQYYIWKSSKDNTFIFLRKMEAKYTYKARIYLYYGTMDGDDLIDTARRLQEEFAKNAEIINSQSSGTEGL